MRKKIYIYNQTKKQKEEFIPIAQNKLKMYVCGPTVYDLFHIGNARPFVVFDFIRRFFEHMGYEVEYVQNFTDIDDKMIKRAAAENITVAEVAEKYIAEYVTDAKGLNIKPAVFHPRATENIDEIIAMIETLIEKGHAYAAEPDKNGASDVYFSAGSFADYGKLTGVEKDELESGIRVEVGELKRDPFDFALWKARKEGEPSWESPWGRGRPGWHIECSAMVKKFLGETIDIHCGGKDLLFPHHENENAQSVCSNGVKFSNYWLHNGFISIDNKKMAKSDGNFFTVREISQKYGYMPIRYFVLASTYRTPVNFSEEIIEAAKNALERIYICGANLEFALKAADKTETAAGTQQAIDEYFPKAIESLCDDFNTADAISHFFDFIREANILTSNQKDPPPYNLLVKAKEIYESFMSLFGFVREFTRKSTPNDKEINALILSRAEAKKSKNFQLADQIRSDLAAEGIVLEDTPQGTKWRRV